MTKVNTVKFFNHLFDKRHLNKNQIIDRRIINCFSYNLSKIENLGDKMFYQIQAYDLSPRAYFDDLNLHIQYAIADVLLMYFPVKSINKLYGTHYQSPINYLSNASILGDICLNQTVVYLNRKTGGLGFALYNQIKTLDTQPQTIYTLRYNTKRIACILKLALPDKYFALLYPYA